MGNGKSSALGKNKKNILKAVLTAIILAAVSAFFILTAQGYLWAKTGRAAGISAIIIFAVITAGVFIKFLLHYKDFKLSKFFFYTPFLTLISFLTIFSAWYYQNAFTVLLLLVFAFFSFCIFYGIIYKDKKELRISFCCALLITSAIVFIYFPSMMLN